MAARCRTPLSKPGTDLTWCRVKKPFGCEQRGTAWREQASTLRLKGDQRSRLQKLFQFLERKIRGAAVTDDPLLAFCHASRRLRDVAGDFFGNGQRAVLVGVD